MNVRAGARLSGGTIHSLLCQTRADLISHTNHERHAHATARCLATLTTTTTVPPPPPPELFASPVVSAADTTKPLTHPIQRTPPTQPPSHRPPEFRKSQLHRQYTSLMLSTPVMLFFQHNNLRAAEWTGIRRELDAALFRAAKVSGETELRDAGRKPKIHVVNGSIFAAALRVLEFYKPGATGEPKHYLSEEAYRATLWPRGNSKAPRTKPTKLEGLFTGPVAVLAFPELSPHLLACALSILSPLPGTFPAPRRREAPGLYEAPVQNGLEKLLLLGARVDGKAMDREGVKWLGSLAARGGLEGLRAEVVGLLQGVGMGLAGTLEGASRSLWSTMESRRMDMDGGDGKKDE